VAVTFGIIKACQKDSTTTLRRHSDARVLRILIMDYIKGYYNMKSPTADTAIPIMFKVIG